VKGVPNQYTLVLLAADRARKISKAEISKAEISKAEISKAEISKAEISKACEVKAGEVKTGQAKAGHRRQDGESTLDSGNPKRAYEKRGRVTIAQSVKGPEPKCLGFISGRQSTGNSKGCPLTIG